MVYVSPRNTVPLSLAAYCALTVFGLTATAVGEEAGKVDFQRDVYPILQRSCLECHGEAKQEGGLRLDRKADALEAAVILPARPDDSEFLRRITLPVGHDEIMPAVGQPLPKRHVAVLKQWIEQGANWPEDFTPPLHWAYVAPQSPELPPVKDLTWVRSPIDRFVLARLEEEGLAPSQPETPAKLVRRVFLDLIGLPPTPDEVNAFVANPSEAAYEQMVDDLLKRPQFGERWARPWLDLARYADSHGFQRDDLRDVWAYRDWVIRALNADMPFDQFSIEQLAGDLLPNATEAQRIATGFHRCTPTNVEAGSLPEETRIAQVIDRVNTTGAIWLGSTLECCQCHDHKYDPFTTKDYYQILAYFNNSEQEADRTNPNSPSSIQFQGPTMPLSNPQRDAQRKGLQTQRSNVLSQQAERRKELDATLEVWGTQLAAQVATAAQSHRLEVKKFTSEGTTDTFERLDDGSVLLVGGDPPDTDTYTLHTTAPLQTIRAFQLDALQDDSLPGKGPGRGDPVRRNFVLNDFTVELHPLEATTDSTFAKGPLPLGQKIEFSAAQASVSQQKWDVLGAVDKDPKSGWAISPQFGQSHWAKFILKSPLDVPEGYGLKFTLKQQFGQARTIGRLRLSAITGDLEADSVGSEIVEIISQPADRWTKAQRQRLLDYRIEQDESSARWSREAAKLEQEINGLRPDTTLVMVELPQPRVSHVFLRGDYRQPGEIVVPGIPSLFSSVPDAAANRLSLAKWLVSPENPLVARVTVNRWWAELFGHGIVSTAEDFGVKGEAPTHPEMLDWLACELIRHDWSMKHVLKTIVLSSTYQQSSRVSNHLLEVDDRNRLLARGPRIRMDAEMIRDNALAVSGLLSLKSFGPPIRPYQPDDLWTKVGGAKYKYEVSPGSEKHRRGLYVVLKRGAPYPSFINFDGSARFTCTIQRSRTNTPLQALTLLNDPVFVEAAQALARRVVGEKSGESLESQLEYAFQLCVARKPNTREVSTLKQLFEPRGPNVSEHEAWYNVATTLLNLHETITKD